MTDAERLAAYKVCQQRGHEPSGMVLTSSPPWQVCRFCGTNYRFTEPQLVEGYNVPVDPDAPQQDTPTNVIRFPISEGFWTDYLTQD